MSSSDKQKAIDSKMNNHIYNEVLKDFINKNSIEVKAEDPQSALARFNEILRKNKNAIPVFDDNTFLKVTEFMNKNKNHRLVDQFNMDSKITTERLHVIEQSIRSQDLPQLRENLPLSSKERLDTAYFNILKEHDELIPNLKKLENEIEKERVKNLSPAVQEKVIDEKLEHYVYHEIFKERINERQSIVTEEDPKIALEKFHEILQVPNAIPVLDKQTLLKVTDYINRSKDKSVVEQFNMDSNKTIERIRDLEKSIKKSMDSEELKLPEELLDKIKAKATNLCMEYGGDHAEEDTPPSIPMKSPPPIPMKSPPPIPMKSPPPIPIRETTNAQKTQPIVHKFDAEKIQDPHEQENSKENTSLNVQSENPDSTKPTTPK